MTICKIQESDFSQADILKLLSLISDSPKIEDSRWSHIINNLPKNHHIYVYSSPELIGQEQIKPNVKILGLISIIIEQKLTHGGQKVAHIEDLVVNPEFHHMGIGSDLLKFAYRLADDNDCYKLILNCKEDLIGFYMKNKYQTDSIQMRRNILNI